ncbi:5d7a90ba-e691-4f7e-83b6-92c6f08ac7ff [Sclerotinia trifoliorum]|uniref:5d7a90ba-e691-4f7e-83b6-92c6f08ac7ff n=1 Tax=Sclerotinia trifoliorum TaxID=28548 RepID=A0A8H2ZPM6_9HELO|nr:5d7a90ba-e691-4f7e-83b6-92c6f08ac7ff [Sclerotinia trifoliorum]
MAFQSLKIEHGAGDLEYDADTESKRPYKNRRRVHRDFTFTNQILKKNHSMGRATPSPRKSNRIYHAEPLFSNPVQEDIHGGLRGPDGSFNAGNDNLATPDWTSDYEDEERIASFIIQKRNSSSDGEIKPFLPKNLIVKIFETMIKSPRKPKNSNTTRNSKSILCTAIEGEDTNSEPSTKNALRTDGKEEEGKAGKNNGGMIDAICFALTCLRYWIIFRDLWCYPSTNRILDEFKLSMTQQLILAPLLETWIGPNYRRSNLLTLHSYAVKYSSRDGSQGYINMFLARKAYGTGRIKKNTRKELSLWRRYKARSQILDCSGQYLEDFMPSTGNSDWKAELPKVQLLSPFGMGTTWYLAAAKQYRDMFTSWKSEYSDRCLLGTTHSNAMILSWGSFMKTSIYRWVKKYKAPVNLSHPSVTQLVMEKAEVVRDIIQLERDVIQDLAIDDVFRWDVWALFPQDEFSADEYGEYEMRTLFRAFMMGDD